MTKRTNETIVKVTAFTFALIGPAVVPSVASAQIEEVLVTARKRTETLQDIPVVASVLSGDQLEQFQAHDLSAISARVPGLLVGTASMAFGSQIFLRGVGSSTLNASLDQSVSLNIDGLQMTQGLAYSAGMFDMAQLEVLKGPQGLFFGKASPGGVISFRTADPTNELEIIARHGYEFEASNNRTDLIISGPVTERLGLRLSSTYSEQDGWMDNEGFAASGLGGKEPRHSDFPMVREWLVRGTALWSDDDKLSARLKVNAISKKGINDGGQTQLASCPDGVSSPSGVPFMGGGEDCKHDKKIRVVSMDPSHYPGIPNEGHPYNEIEQRFGSLELNYDVSRDLTVTSVTGFYDIDQVALHSGVSTNIAGSPIAANPSFSRKEYTQEVRVTSAFSESPINFMVGGFYQDAEVGYDVNLIGNTAIGLPGLLQRGSHTVDISTLSLFGQILWTPVPEFELAAGARWTDEERTHEVVNLVTGSPVIWPTATPELSETDVSPEVTLTYRPADALTLFGSYKVAFKSGSFDTTTIGAPGQEVSFGDEKVSGFEVGLKSLILDRRLQFNLGLYHYEYEDLQVGANETTESGVVVIRTYNAAGSKVYGAEMDLQFIPESLPDLTLYAAANYNRATYDDFSNAQCWGGQRIQDGCNRVFDVNAQLYRGQDLSDKIMARAPRWTGNIGASYSVNLGHGMRANLGWYSSYSDKYLTNMLGRDDMWQDSHFIHNASLSLLGPEDKWEIALMGTNLEGKLIKGNCTNMNSANGVLFGGIVTGGSSRGPAGVEELVCDVASHRAVWLRFSMRLDQLM